MWRRTHGIDPSTRAFSIEQLSRRQRATFLIRAVDIMCATVSQLPTLSRVCERLDGPMRDVIRDAERAGGQLWAAVGPMERTFDSFQASRYA